MRFVTSAIVRLFVLGTLACAMTGCARSADPGEGEAALVSVTRSGPVSLRVESSRDTLRTVDRVEVRVLVTLGDGATLDELTIDPESEGWTVVTDHREAPRVLGDTTDVLHVRTLTLEPFLEGDYAIPNVSAAWSQGERSGVAVTETMAITVNSVLAEDDTLEIGGLREAPAPVDARAGTQVARWVIALVGAGAVALLMASISLVLWLSRGRSDPARAIVARLERVAAGSAEPGAACAEAAAALRTIAPASGAKRTRDLIDRLDDARFEPGGSGADRARALVRDAVEHARSLLTRQGART